MVMDVTPEHILAPSSVLQTEQLARLIRLNGLMRRAALQSLDLPQSDIRLKRLAALIRRLERDAIRMSVSPPEDHWRGKILRPRMRYFESSGSDGERLATTVLELTGLKMSDLQISTRSGQIVVSGERKPLAESNQTGDVAVDEFKYGKFLKCIDLPSGIEDHHITKVMDNGMLTLQWPLSVPHVKLESSNMVEISS
ncbi:hypothetical protein BD410DRAFT_842069 [Rickenella mellea]|uniref:SHSP domain-containing protein n=1 Tax=Rickenella mellea TaxID=50990 RepID=A0A4Y7PVV5_9AGAM|nr:hypothetical protein BD410DRAFT_842069 [Rickenella mellea]